ncbi:hypothetical protein YC2023_015044 [Brassica napus]
MSEPEQVKGAIDFVGVINYMEHYVKDKSSSLNQNLHDFNIDMAVRRRPQSSSLEDTKRFKYLSSHIEAMLYSLR